MLQIFYAAIKLFNLIFDQGICICNTSLYTSFHYNVYVYTVGIKKGPATIQSAVSLLLRYNHRTISWLVVNRAISIRRFATGASFDAIILESSLLRDIFPSYSVYVNRVMYSSCSACLMLSDVMSCGLSPHRHLSLLLATLYSTFSLIQRRLFYGKQPGLFIDSLLLQNKHCPAPLVAHFNTFKSFWNLCRSHSNSQTKNLTCNYDSLYT